MLSSTLKGAQKERVLKALSFNGFFPSGEQPNWKVFIYDSQTQPLIALLLKVSELRAAGVTVFKAIANLDFEPIDAPAVFVISPESLPDVARLLGDGLFSSAFVNVSTTATSKEIENFASDCVAASSADRVFHVWDLLCHFYCPEERLFHFNLPSYDNAPEIIADRLFFIFATIGSLPIIRWDPSNSRCEKIAKKLSERIRDHLHSSSVNCFSQGAINRPLLVLIDRKEDLVTPLRHHWCYNQMIHDECSITVNRATIQSTSYDLDTADDDFWLQFSSSETFQVASSLDAQLNSYLAEKDSLPKELSAQFEAKITALAKKKRLIDLHTAIATHLLQSVKDRSLDSFISVEEQCLSKATGVKSAVRQLLSGGLGTDQDKAQLASVFAITCGSEEDSLWLLPLIALDYRSLVKSLLSSKKTPPSNSPNGVFSSLASGIKNFLPSQSPHQIPSILERVIGMEPFGWEYLDPKSGRSSDKIFVPERGIFNDVYCFVVGGTNYAEYNSISNIQHKYPGLKITLGGDHILRSGEFLSSFVQSEGKREN